MAKLWNIHTLQLKSIAEITNNDGETYTCNFHYILQIATYAKNAIGYTRKQRKSTALALAKSTKKPRLDDLEPYKDIPLGNPHVRSLSKITIYLQLVN